MYTAKLVSFLLLNFAAVATSVMLSMALFKFKPGTITRLALATFLIFTSQIVLIQILLGVLGLLTYENVTILTYCIFVWVCILYGWKSIKALGKQKIFSLPSLSLAVIIFTPLIATFGLKLINASLQIPMEYDAVSYHLPFVVEWMQTGSLNKIYYSAFAGPLGYYPSTYELLDLWVALPFWNDYFWNLLNFPFYIFLALTVFGVLQNLKVDKNIALVTSAIPLYMPIFIRQAGLPLVDLFFTLTFALGLFFLLEYLESKEHGWQNLLLVGLAIGLFIGTKYLGLVYGAVFIVIASLIVLWSCFARRSIYPIYGLKMLIVGLFLTGSFFYLRNYISTGNPIFPVEVTLNGITLFKGYMGAQVNELLESTTLLNNLNVEGTIKEFFTSFFYLTGPIGVLSIFLPAILLLNAIYSTLKLKAHDLAVSLLLAFGLLAFFILYIKSPYTYRDMLANVRYAMPFLTLGAISLGYLANKLKWEFLYFLFTIPILYKCLFMAVNPPESIPYTDHFRLDWSQLQIYRDWVLLNFIAIFIFGISVFVILKLKAKYRYVIAGILLIPIFIIRLETIKFTSYEREALVNESIDYWFEDAQNIRVYMQAGEWFDTKAPRVKIAYTGFNFHYQLYGRELRREVDYVNINDCLECRYSDYRDHPDSIRRDPSYDAWVKNLESMGKQYVVVNPLDTPQVRNYEFEWMQANPRKFDEVAKIGEVRIFKITDA